MTCGAEVLNQIIIMCCRPAINFIEIIVMINSNLCGLLS
jgi:hypothetical protein